MNFSKIFFAGLILAAGCADQEAATGSNAVAGEAEGETTEASTQKTVTLKPEEIAPDNVIIDDNGVPTALGSFSAHPFGSPDPVTGEVKWTGAPSKLTPSGPTIVYIFKSIPPESLEVLEEFNIEAEENTAYLLPYGAEMGLEALQGMQLIGPIDPSLSYEALAALFRVGGGEDATKVTDPKDAEYNGLHAYVEPTEE